MPLDQIAQIAADTKALKRTYRDAHCTYFPMEQVYQVHVWGVFYGQPSTSRSAAIASGIDALKAAGVTNQEAAATA